MAQCRDHGIDNLKAIAIFMAVLSHMIRLPFASRPALFPLQAFVQSFTMPLFIFLSGYLGKNTGRNTRGIFSGLLVPFFVYNLFYWILAKRSASVLGSIFTPYQHMWYLLSLFSWRLLMIPFEHVRKPAAMTFSVLAALAIGALLENAKFLTVGRTIGFFPYYLLGFWCTSEHIRRVRAVPKYIWLTLFLLIEALEIWAVAIVRMVPVEAYFDSLGYRTLGQSIIQGAAYRLGNMLLSTILVASLINLVPDKEYRWSETGKNTLYIYLYHLAAAMLFKWIVAKAKLQWLGDSLWLGGPLLILLSLLLTWLFENRHLIRLHVLVWGKVSKLLEEPERAV